MRKSEREVAKKLIGLDGAYAIGHDSLNGRHYLKFRTLDHSNIMLVTPAAFRKMEEKEWVVKDGQKYTVNVPAFVDNYNHWLDLKAKREERKMSRKPRKNKAA